MGNCPWDIVWGVMGCVAIAGPMVLCARNGSDEVIRDCRAEHVEKRLLKLFEVGICFGLAGGETNRAC